MTYKIKSAKKAELFKSWCDLYGVSMKSAQREIDRQMSDVKDRGVVIVGKAEDESSPYIPALTFQRAEFVEEKPYRADAWNTYPESTPPIGTLMRVEVLEEEEGKNGEWHFLAAAFNGKEWILDTGFKLTVKPSILRFRPWHC